MMTPLSAIRQAFEQATAFSSDDLWAIDAVAATYLSLRWKAASDPMWLFLIAPSSSGKDVLLNAFTTLPHHLKVSVVTANSLLSAYDPKQEGPARAAENDPSALRHWDDNIVVFADFTTMLTQGQRAVDAFLGQLRDVFGGTFAKESGTVGYDEVESRFGLIVSCTPQLDQFNEKSTQMGERFLTVRISRNGHGTLKARIKRTASVAQYGSTRHIWGDLLSDSVCRSILLAIGDLPDDTKPPIASGDDEELLGALADIVMMLKSRPVGGVSQTPPSGARLANQLRLMVFSRALLDGRRELNDADRYFARRIAYDIVDAPTRRMLAALNAQGSLTPDQLRVLSGHNSGKRLTPILNQWMYTHVIKATKSKSSYKAYDLHDEFREIISDYAFMDGNLEGPPS